MKGPKKRQQEVKTTTIQVHSSLKNELDLLKIMLGKDDLNALIAELAKFYVVNKQIPIDPKIEAFLKKLKK